MISEVQYFQSRLDVLFYLKHLLNKSKMKQNEQNQNK